jgi:cysteinyl-tRNA synthetase
MKLYNTIKKAKEEFKPINKEEVRMYSCGPTVYNYFHIGNARPFIVFDILRRYLEYSGYKVKFVQNFTDIDDKLIKKANEEGISVKEVGEKYIEEYYKDAHALGIKDATIAPKATENIEEIIEFIKVLIEKNHAYNVDGDVYFDVSSFAEYGKLSGQNLDDLDMGSRINVGEKKKGAMDFVLWKAKKEGEPSWDSPWGEGRPGWHIECSVMANRFLGETIDIHSGGNDLIFPHHENEIAQSEAATGKPFANYWLHNGFINIDNQKMSKSKGNFFTVRDILADYDAEVLRFFMMTAHYRKPVNFSDELLNNAKKGLDRIYTCLSSLEYEKKNAENGKVDENIKAKMQDSIKDFKRAMDDDLNTADALASIFNTVKEANNYMAEAEDKNIETLQLLENTIHEAGDVLGLLRKTVENESSEEIDELIVKRQKARQEKDWAEADRIRDKLNEMNIIIEDTKDGVKWRKK